MHQRRYHCEVCCKNSHSVTFNSVFRRVNVNRVAAYKELDTDLVKNAAFMSLNGVNLSLLAEKLYNENLTKEPDEVWNWNLLFTQVASEVNSETRKNLVT